MDIRELQHFMEVVNQKSFTKAAATIHLSQPALSKIVKKLEEELGVDLFDRSTRKLTLTDAGQIVYGQSQKLVSTLHELHALLDDLRNLPTGDIKVGIPPLVGTVVFPMIAKNFTSKHPQVNIRACGAWRKANCRTCRKRTSRPWHYRVAYSKPSFSRLSVY